MSRDITPISFKTVPGRNKTQKWTKAPAVDYGGDDWGGYDDYGDYEEDVPPPPPAIPTSHAPRDPYASSSGHARQNSFDQGDETRAFSSGVPPSNAVTSGGRDFTNPEQVPAPLSMHSSPAPPQGERWPGRKESMSSKGTPPIASTSQSPAEKPLPFIRPSDIYKRIPDEIRRQSEEGTRPSMDSLGSGPRERTGLGLDTVAESRESRIFMDQTDGHSTDQKKDTSPRLPDVQRFSGFGTEFLTGSAGENVPPPASQYSPESVVARVANAPFVSTTGTTSPTASSIQNTPTSRNLPGQDPAAEILAERQHDTSVERIAGGQPATLQHQPSAGFRSAVHTAFDRNDNSMSRDNSQGSADVHRSDTTSTAGISPIISRGPQFPSIAEETTAPMSLHSLPADTQAMRKSSPDRSRGADFQPGYRRSLDPPSTGTSPARTPGLETTAARRLSTPMSAVPMDAESPDVLDQGAEMPSATLEPAETPASELGELHNVDGSSSTTAAVPITGRGRSNTDYSIRESDIAQTVNSSSPEQGHEMPGLIDAQRDSQKLFLQTHTEKQPPSPISPGGGLRDGGSGSRAGSPAKGRVREIADKYHGLDEAARRNSAASIGSGTKALSTKSSWSNFDDGEKKLSRQGTGQTEGEMFPAYGNADLSPERPGVSREQSFRPDLPGGWISSAPTPVPEEGPGAGRASPLTPQQSKVAEADDEELTPTTKKTRLQEALTHEPSAREIADSNSPSALEQVRNAGSELGAAIMSSVGIGHQTRDFASAEPAAPVDDEREIERPVRGPQPPALYRHETDSSAAPSVASTMPPSPPAKDTPKIGETLSDGYFNTVAPLRVKSREQSPNAERNPANERGLSAARPGVSTALSMEPGAEDLESDRLRKEIVRSLDPIPPVEDVQLTQDALDAPDNQRRIALGDNAQPPAESRQPALLQTRFSWEKPTPMSEQSEPLSPEIKPEMSYERPRSKALHVVNPNEVDSPIVETPVQRAPPEETLKPTTFGTPVTEKQGPTLLPETNVQPGSPSQSLKDIAPSPISERASDRDAKRQSYYASDSSQPAATSSPTILPGQNGLSTSPISPSKGPASGKPIPPFRNILALKTGDERIKTYNDTRATFANMNTGLGDWVGGMLALHPELASNATTSSGAWKAPPLQTSGTGFLKNHKASPSLAKFTNKFGSESQMRSTSVGSVGEDGAPSSTSAAGGGSIRPTTSNTTGPSSSTTGLPAFDTDKMQQKGKAFMAKTGVLGGKAQAGAKGLFAKGKSRFASGGSVRGPSGGGSDKVTSPSFASRVQSSRAVSSPVGSTNRAVSSAAISSPITATVEPTPDVAASTPVEPMRVEAAPLPTSAKLQALSVPPVGTKEAATSSSVPSEAITGSEEATHADNLSGHEPSQPVEEAAKSNALTPAIKTNEEAALGVEEIGAVFVPPPPVDEEGSALARLIKDSNEKNSLASLAKDVDQNALQVATLEKESEPLPTNVTTSKAVADDHQQPDSPLTQINTSPAMLTAPTMASAAEAPKTAADIHQNSEDSPLTQINTSPPMLTAPTMLSTSTARPSSAYATTGPNTPISAIRPSFSRHTSSKSASPFRGNSPFRRDASQTPGSESRSRPLSMVDWLREKTRSVSRNSRRGEGSRPASLVVLDKDDSIPSTPLAVSHSGELALGDLSDVAVFSSSTTAPMDVPKRTETWNAPDAAIPPKTPETRDLVLERLGVLPSPAPTAVTFESLGSRKRRRSSAARLGSAGIEGLGLDLETVPSQETAEESPSRSINGGLAGRGSPVRSPMRKVSESQEEVVVMRPRQQRRVSDLEMLPSEQKRLSLGLGMPRPDSMILLQSQVDLLAGVEKDDEHDGPSKGETDEIHPDPTKGAPHFALDRSRPATRSSSYQMSADVWDDARSEVSAEEGAADEAQGASTNTGTSRHSSVSSLGAPETAAAVQGSTEEPTTSTHPVPISPDPANMLLSTTAPATSLDKPKRPPMLDRPLSYMPLPRDEAGLPLPETITTASLQQAQRAPPVQHTEPAAPLQQRNRAPSLQQIETAAPLQQTNTTASLAQTNTLSSNESPVAVDLSAMSGPPPGTPPFQQHPVFRNSVVQDEATEGTSAAVGNGPLAGVQDASVEPEDARAKRRSGFFGKQQRGEEQTFNGAPPPNRITDQHGLEDLHASDDEVVPDIQSRSKGRQPADNDKRRRSGLWDVLTTKRASSGAKLDTKEDFVADVPETSGKTREENGKRKLRKPQRAASSAVDLEPKKKRFSALGSLFGRSGTTGHGSSKPNKLTKMIPSSNENVRGSGSPRQNRPANSSTVSGNVTGYDEFEARRKRDLPAYQQTLADTRPMASGGAQGRSEGPVDLTPTQPPPAGWYGPGNGEQPMQQPYSAPAEEPQPQFRRLHSSGRANNRSVNQVPPAFRPVEASFNAPVQPVGPPPNPNNSQNSQTAPGHIPGHARGPSFNRQMSYESSYGSEFSGFSGQQVASRNQQYPQSQRSFGPDVSPIQTRAAPPEGQRVVSAGYETARSPAKDYPDQQTPWAITIPPGQGSGRNSRASSWGVAEGAQYTGSPSQAPYYQPQQYPMQPGYSRNGGYRPPSQGQTHIPRSYTNDNDAYAPPYSAHPAQQYQHHQYTSPPPQMQNQYAYPPPQQYQQPRQQNCYYSQPQHFSPQQQQYDSRQMYQRRRSSGYSGRRDDLTAGEEDLIMRGVSYPGQEWQPPGLGRSY